MHLITLQAKANAQQRDARARARSHTLTDSHRSSFGGIDQYEDFKRATNRKRFYTTHHLQLRKQRKLWGGGEITELCKCPLKSIEATLYDSH